MIQNDHYPVVERMNLEIVNNTSKLVLLITVLIIIIDTFVFRVVDNNVIGDVVGNRRQCFDC